MCKICVDYEKGKLTLFEAWQNTGEMSKKDPHWEEVTQKLIKAAAESPDECDED